MPRTQTQSDENIKTILDLIMQSDSIPEEHKMEYIEYIERNGFDEKMIQELSQIFERDRSALEQDISSDEEALADLDRFIAEEHSKNAEPQARILAAFGEYLDKKLKDQEKIYDNIELELGKEMEAEERERESVQEAAIRAKLKLPPKGRHGEG